MAAALLAADGAAQALPAALFTGAHAGAVGLKVHRNTVLGALANALRLAFPAIDKLVGEAFFDRMAVEFSRAQPPREPQLDEYGAEFSAFIDGFPGTDSLPYLGELARFEWQFAALARCRAAPFGVGPSLTLDDGLRLQFASPLRLHASRFPVDALRAAILADDTAALQRIELRQADYHHALWRSEAGVNVRALSDASARFIAAIYAGADATTAVAAAAQAAPGQGQGEDAVAQAVAREILPAGFVQLQKPGNGP